MPHAFHIMTKPTGPLCNLDCVYCFYLEKEKLYRHTSDFRMSDEVLDSFIRQKIENHRVNKVSFAWQGGEPTLLGVGFFEKVVELQNKYANGKDIENGFQTNGILLNEEWCLFFKENNFLIGLSIDGPENLHDRYRVNKGQKPTFRRVISGMEMLKKHDVDFNTLTVVHRENAKYPHEVYQFLRESGSGYMQFIPLVERKASESTDEGLKLVSPVYTGEADITEWSVETEQFGNFLCAVFDEWVRRDVAQQFIQIFDVALEAWMGMDASLCVFRKICGDAMVLEHNGDLYSCDHYVYPQNKLGNIMDNPLPALIGSYQQVKFGQEKFSTLPSYCLNCEVRFVCNGECPKHRFIKTPDGEAGLNYLCAGYKKFFKHIDPYMNFMSNELRNNRPPANVMSWAKEKDRGFPSFKLGPNDPCPCGSGNKLKKCCRKIK